VFDAVAKETVADVLKGYHGTVFAYGQTVRKRRERGEGREKGKQES
jgi:hypothetical protein